MRRALLALLLLAAPAAEARTARKPTDAATLRDPARLVALGRKLEEQGDHANAMRFYERAIEIDPQYTPALDAAGSSTLARGDGTAAFGYYAGWASQDPANAVAMLGMGAALVLRQQPEEAMPVLARALALGAGLADVGHWEGVALDLSGKPDEAQVAYAHALRAAPDDRRVIQRLALSLAISGERTAALQLLEKFVGDAEAPDVMRTLALVYALTGDLKTAIEIAGASLPPREVETLGLFYSRLPELDAAGKARAAHFGRLPAPVPSVGEPPRLPPQDVAAEIRPPSRSVVSADVGGVATLPRIWVQLSSRANRTGLVAYYASVQAKAGGELNGFAAFVQTLPDKCRLLVGPFDASSPAEELVLRLKSHGVDAVVARTPAGADITSL